MSAPQGRNPIARHRAIIGLGANLDDPRAQLEAALAELARLPDTQLVRQSSFYRTAPLGRTDQPDFINAAAMITTSLPATDLLSRLLEIEHNHGRLRAGKDGPRRLDLDLLLYGEEIIADADLAVPHPRMHLRRFALEPLLELDPDCTIPGRGRADDCLAKLADARDQAVERLP